MTYCQSGDKPIVSYSFGGSSSSTKMWQSPYAPIDVISKPAPVDGGTNYSQQGFFYSVNSPQASGGVASGYIIDYQVFNLFFSTFDSKNGKYMAVIPCGQSSYSRLANCDDAISQATSCLSTFSISSTPVFDNTRHCPPPTTNKCAIEVMYSGLIIFQDQGDCPLNFSVQCGSCPDGTTECSSPVYPGYCCQDCGSVQSRIDALTSKVLRYGNHV